MEYYKTVRENQYGKYVIIHAHEFKEGVEYAAKLKIEQIHLRSVVGRENLGAIVDFKELKNLAEHLRVIIFSDAIENIINFEFIYSLKNIERISFQRKQKFQIDISKFLEIQHFGSDYWKGLDFRKAYSLTSIVLSKLTDINLSQFSELKNLKILHIYQSKILTLEGIEGLQTEELSLAYCNSLKDIQVVNNLLSLRKLDIEKCKLLINYSFLKTNSFLENLFIDNLDSLNFVPAMLNLKAISFRNCIDGNLLPLLESNSLEKIAFYPNKKHYTHKEEQILEITGVRRGKNV